MNSRSSKISVIMPVFNGERYLRSAIDSILQQTFPDFEFVIVDDGSTDGTLQILQSYTDPRIVVRRIEHAGLIPALNVAVQTAQGDLLARMDADDRSLPDRLKLQLRVMADRPEVCLVTGAAELIGPDDAIIGMQPSFSADDMELELAARNPIVHGSVMMRRAALPNPVYRQRPEDYVLWHELVSNGCRFFALPDTIYQFRTHGERYSIREGVEQSAAAIELQWQLLQNCMKTRDSTNDNVREKLMLGWGIVAGYCFHSLQYDRGKIAMSKFDELFAKPMSKSVAAAADHAIEAMVWGGCPFADQRRYRQWQVARHPLKVRAWKNLLQTYPIVQSLRHRWKKKHK